MSTLKRIPPLTDDQHMLIGTIVDYALARYEGDTHPNRVRYRDRLVELKALVDSAEIII